MLDSDCTVASWWPAAVGAPVVRTPCVPRGAWRTNGCITVHAYEYGMKVPSYCVWQWSWHTHRAGHATSWNPTRWTDAHRLTHGGAKSAMFWYGKKSASTQRASVYLF